MWKTPKGLCKQVSGALCLNVCSEISEFKWILERGFWNKDSVSDHILELK